MNLLKILLFLKQLTLLFSVDALDAGHSAAIDPEGRFGTGEYRNQITPCPLESIKVHVGL